MTPTNNKLLVACNIEQKREISIGGVILRSASSYDVNYRERSPVIAVAKETKGEIAFDDILLTHHNLYYSPSPFYLFDDLFSIPYTIATIFAVIDKDGNPRAVCGNIIAEEVEVETPIPLPPEQKTFHKDRARVLDSACGYQKGQLVFTRPSTPYIIVYIWNGMEKRVVKINSEMILGKVVK